MPELNSHSEINLSTEALLEAQLNELKNLSYSISIKLAEKVRKLTIDGELSPFLSYNFLLHLERGKHFERKGA